MKGKLRLIARLDVKDENLVKGIQFEGLRKLGPPRDFARRYYRQGIDEVLYLDTVASLYGRNNLAHVLEEATRDVFVPITAGGGLRSVEDVRALLRAGADKAAINTAALRDPTLITRVAEVFGSQCMVVSIQAKRTANGWEAYCDNGREHTGLDVLDWVCRAQALGAGEILLTSVDCEGVGKGMDIPLYEAVCARADVPVIAAGGAGCAADVAGAARAFHQFACDRAGLYLALGLASSAAALALCGWYVFHAPALSLGRLAGLLLLFLALSAVTALVFLGLTLGAFWLKFKAQHMDADKWTAYFEGLSTPALLVRLGLLMGAALLLTSALAALVFQWTGFSQPIQLALVFCVISALRLARKFGQRREELVEKLLRLKPEGAQPQ